jgi:uncharacterized protein (UPF0262 family)
VIRGIGISRADGAAPSALALMAFSSPYARELVDEPLAVNGDDESHFIIDVHLDSDHGLILLFKDTAKRVVHGRRIENLEFSTIAAEYCRLVEKSSRLLKSGTTAQYQANDIERRGTHNSGAQLLQTELEPEVVLEFEPARNLFFICAHVLIGERAAAAG